MIEKKNELTMSSPDVTPGFAEFVELKIVIKSIVMDWDSYLTKKVQAILDAQGGTVQDIPTEKKRKLMDEWLEEFSDAVAKNMMDSESEA